MLLSVFFIIVILVVVKWCPTVILICISLMASDTEHFFMGLLTIYGFPGGSDGKESACNAGDLGSIPGFHSWIGKIPCRREWLPTPVFLPGEFHERKSLVGYSPWDRRESDTTQ